MRLNWKRIASVTIFTSSAGTEILGLKITRYQGNNPVVPASVTVPGGDVWRISLKCVERGS